jgi:hypothetical protein
MQADIDEVVHVKFEGDLTKLQVEVYNMYILHMNMTNQYITEELGFKLNSHDNCVANKLIDGTKCTILWHMDDLKMSHVCKRTVDSILHSLNENCGK